MAKKARRLKNIETAEVSLVESPANKVPFLFFKQKGKPADGSLLKQKKKLSIEIESDGTAKGTKVTINGDVMKSLRDFNFSFYGGMDTDKDIPVSCSYSKVVESTDGFSRTESFYLAKGKFEMEELKQIVRKYLGDDKAVFEKAEKNEEAIEALTSSMRIVTEYQKDFPEDLEEAIGVIAKQAVLSTVLVSKQDEEKDNSDDEENADEKEEQEAIEKAGARFSGSTLKKLRSVVTQLQDLLKDAKVGKSDEKKDGEDIQKSIVELAESIKGMKESSSDKEIKEISKSLKSIIERLGAVEEATGIKKSIDDQDGDDDDEKENDERKWPSISSPRK